MQYILLSTLIVSGVAFRQQSVGVKGRLLCGDQPLTGAIIRLINHKTFGNIFPIVIHDSGFDEQLAETHSDDAGFYSLEGGMGELLKMDVRMKIITKCNTARFNPCDREIVLGIPGEYVTRTDRVENWFNGGNLQTQFSFKDEETKCL